MSGHQQVHWQLCVLALSRSLDLPHPQLRLLVKSASHTTQVLDSFISEQRRRMAQGSAMHLWAFAQQRLQQQRFATPVTGVLYVHTAHTKVT